LLDLKKGSPEPEMALKDAQRRLANLTAAELEAQQIDLWEDMLNEPDAALSAKMFTFGFAKTFDPHDSSTPAKPFPEPFDRPGLVELIELWANSSLLLVEKSRQELISWLFCTLYTWETIRYRNKFTFFQARKLKDAGLGPPKLALLWRAKFIINNLPGAIRPSYKEHRRDHILELDSTGSSIMGISADFDGFRLYTGSGVLADELAYQPNAEGGFQAVHPTLGEGCRYTGISSPNGKNWFYRKAYDRA